MDSTGSVYVTDQVHSRVQKFTSDGAFVSKFSVGGNPLGVDVDAAGNIFVTSSVDNQVTRYSQSGAVLEQWGSAGGDPGEFKRPADVAVDGDGVWVSDIDNHRVQLFLSDTDNDTVPDRNDHCPAVPNNGQTNNDGDESGCNC